MNFCSVVTLQSVVPEKKNVAAARKKIVDFLNMFLMFPLLLVPAICVIQDSLKFWRRNSKGLRTHPVREYKAVDVLSAQKQTQFPRENWQLTFIYTWVYVCKTNICAEKMNKTFHSGIFLSIRFSLCSRKNTCSLCPGCIKSTGGINMSSVHDMTKGC